MWDWYLLLGAAGVVREKCEGRAERYVWDWYWLLGAAGGVREQ